MTTVTRRQYDDAHKKQPIGHVLADRYLIDGQPDLPLFGTDHEDAARSIDALRIILHLWATLGINVEDTYKHLDLAVNELRLTSLKEWCEMEINGKHPLIDGDLVHVVHHDGNAVRGYVDGRNVRHPDIHGDWVLTDKYEPNVWRDPASPITLDFLEPDTASQFNHLPVYPHPTPQETIKAVSMLGPAFTWVLTLGDKEQAAVQRYIRARMHKDEANPPAVILAALRMELPPDSTDRALHIADMRRVSEYLAQEAKDREWCEEFDHALDDLNTALSVPLTPRTRELTVTVRGTLEVEFTKTVTITVKGTNSVSELLTEIEPRTWFEDSDFTSFTASIDDWDER